MLKQKIQQYQQEHLLRFRRTIENRDEMVVQLKGVSLVNFCSSDYLSLAAHPKVKKAFAQAAHQYGLGSGSAALISGYFNVHRQLEENLAEFLNRDRVLLFNSGYHANIGVLSTLAKRTSYIIGDKLCHASLLDGMVLSRAKQVRYAHHNYQQAERVVACHADKNILLVSESLFSMEGSLTDIRTLAGIAERYGATLIIDDAHGVGVLGKAGRGACEYFNVSQKEVPCLITTFGKAMGSFGAVVSGPHDMIEELLQFARPYIFTTTLPPAVCAGTLAALSILRSENWRREKLQYLATFFNREAKACGLQLTSWNDVSPIKSILIGDNQKTLRLQEQLLQQGFLVSCIRPPTVPKKSARIRISLNCLHTEDQILRLLELLV